MSAFRERPPESGGISVRRRHALLLASCAILILGVPASFLTVRWRLISDQAQALTSPPLSEIHLRAGLNASYRITACVDAAQLPQALLMYSDLTGRLLFPPTNGPLARVDDFFGERLSRWHIVKRAQQPDSGIAYHADGQWSAGELKERLESVFKEAGLIATPVGQKYFRVRPVNIAAATVSRSSSPSLKTNSGLESPAAARR